MRKHRWSDDALYQEKDGSVMILFLWVMMLFSLFALSVGFRSRLATKIEGYEMKRFERTYEYLSVINLARYFIEADEEPEVDYALDGWYGTPAEFNSLALSDDFELEISDEESKININKAPEAFLLEFFESLKKNGYSLKTDTKKLAGSILAWRGSAPRLGAPMIGKSLKFGLFESLEELYLLEDVKLEDIELLKPFFTVYGSAAGPMKVNINTVSPLILEAMINFLSGDDFSKRKLFQKLTSQTSTVIDPKSGEETTAVLFKKEDLERSRFLIKLNLPTNDPRMIRLVNQLIPQLTVDSQFFAVRIKPKMSKNKGMGLEAVLGDRVIPRMQGTLGLRSIGRTGKVKSLPLEILAWREKLF